MNKNNKKIMSRKAYKPILLVCLMFIISINLINAVTIDQIFPTYSPFITTNSSVPLQFNITNNNLTNLKLNWDGTNYTFFDNRLVLFYNFDNRSALGENDTKIVDLSMYGNNGTTENNLNWDSTLGRQNGGFNWTGANYSTGSPRKINFNVTQWINNGTDNYTASIWIKPYNYTNPLQANDAQIFCLYGQYDGWLKYYSSGYVIFVVRNGSDQSISSTPNSVPLNTWSFLTVKKTKYDSYHNIKIYVNGIEKQSKNFTGNIIFTAFSGNSYGMLGAHTLYSSTNYNAFNGTMDDLMIWNKSLSSDEILQVYHTQHTKYDSQNHSVSFNQTIKANPINYQLCISNGTSICSNLNSINRISTITSNFTNSIGNIRNDFYGNILHSAKLIEGNIDTNCDGISETPRNYAWQKQTMLDSKIKSVSFDLSLDSYYDGISNLDAEEWINISGCGSSLDKFAKYWSTQNFNGAVGCVNRAEGLSGYGINISNKNTSNPSQINLRYMASNGINFTDNKVYNASIWLRGNATVNLFFITEIDYIKFGTLSDIIINDTWRRFDFGANLTSPNNYFIVIENINANETIIADNLSITQDGNPISKWWSIKDYTGLRQNVQFNRENGITTSLLCAYMPYFLANISNPSSSLCIDSATDVDTSDCMTNDLQTFSDICIDAYQQVDNYYNDSNIWIWNEPYNAFFEDNLPNNYAKNDFVILFNSTYNAIKTYSPNIKVIGYGDTSLDYFGLYSSITNFTRMMFSNLSSVFNETHTFSFHPYANHYLGYYSISDAINNTIYLANTYGIVLNRIYLNEWQPTNQSLKNESLGQSNRYKIELAYFFQDILNGDYANITTEMYYHWDDSNSYFNCPSLYSEYPSFWSSVSEAGLDNPTPTYYPSYTITKNFATLCPANGQVFVSSSTDNEIKVVTCKDNSNPLIPKYNIILINTVNETKNGSINGLPTSIKALGDIDSGLIYLNNNPNIVLDPYDVKFLTSDYTKIAVFNNSLSTENLTFTGSQDIIRYLNIPRGYLVNFSKITLRGSEKENNDILIENISMVGVPFNDGSFTTYGLTSSTNVYGNFTCNGSCLGAKLRIKGGAEFYATNIYYFNYSKNDWQLLKTYGNTAPGDYTHDETYTVPLDGLTNPIRYRMEKASSYGEYIDFYEAVMYFEDTLNLSLFINNNLIWSANNFTSTITLTNISNSINNYLRTCTYISGICSVPFTFHSDTAGILSYSSMEFDLVDHIENNISYSSEVGIQQSNVITGNFSFGAIPTYLVLNYNGTLYTPTITIEGYNYILSNTVISPLLASNGNISLFYNFTVNGVNYISSIKYQTVNTVSLTTNCNGNYSFLNITNYNEETLNLMNGTVEYILTLLSSNLTLFSMNGTSNGTNISICSTQNLSDGYTNYNLQLRYYNSGFQYETYNIQNNQVTNLPIQIPLYFINSSIGTQFKIYYTDFYYLTYPNAIMQIQRQYLSTNNYLITEIPKLDNNGMSIASFNTNNIRYKIIVINNGIILDTFEDVFPSCQNVVLGTCELNLRGKKTTESSTNGDFTYTLEKTNSSIILTYIIPSGTPRNINLVTNQNSRFLDMISNCNQTIFASGGTMNCNYNQTVGDSVIDTIITNSDGSILYGHIKISEDLSSFFALNNYFIAFIILLSIGLMFTSSPVMMILGGALGLLYLGLIFLLRGFDVVTVSSSLAWLLVAVGILIYFISKKEDRT